MISFLLALVLTAPIANDGLDDYPAIQAALDADCHVQLGAGVYEIVHNQTPTSSNRFHGLRLRAGCSLRGVGAATVLRFSGNQGHADYYPISFMTGSHNASISHVLLDTGALINTEEQTHAINIRGSLGVTIDHVWFSHPGRGGIANRLPAFVGEADDDVLTTTVVHGYVTGRGPLQLMAATTLPAPLAPLVNYWVIVVDATHFRLATSLANATAGLAVDLTTDGSGVGLPMSGGDCIKVVAYDNVDPSPDEPASAIVTNNHFLTCARSALASVGGFRGLLFEHNMVHDTVNQDLDIEANNPAYDAVVNGNYFGMGSHSTGTYSVAISSPRLDRLVFTNNTLNGRGAFFYSTHHSTISNNLILCLAATDKCVSMIKSNDDVTIASNVIVRAATSLPEITMEIVPHSSGLPGLITLTGNVIRNETMGATVLNSAAARLVATGNSFEWRPPPGDLPAATTLVATSGSAQRILTFSLVANEFVGPAKTAVAITGLTFGVAATTLAANTARGPLAGFACKQTLTPVGPLVSAANNWPAPTTNQCAVSAGN